MYVLKYKTRYIDCKANTFLTVQYYKWNKIGFLNTVESYGSDGTYKLQIITKLTNFFVGSQQFLALAKDLDVVIATFQTDATTLQDKLKLFKDANVHVVLTMVAVDNCTFLYQEILYVFFFLSFFANLLEIN